jgi:hypothetical protein
MVVMPDLLERVEVAAPVVLEQMAAVQTEV